MPKPLIDHSVYPFDYDKNVAENRFDEMFASKFGNNFNTWAQEIKQSLLPSDSIMNSNLDEAKRLITTI